MALTEIYSTSSEAFTDRRQAAQTLVEHLEEYSGSDSLVLGIPRGGVVIADCLANSLDVQMDVVLTHKLGAPANPELAIGAVSEDGHLILDDQLAAITGASRRYIEEEKAKQLEVINSRVKQYREILAKSDVGGRTVILTDDGIATGATMQAAVWAVKAEGAAEVVVAVPVGPADSLERIAEDADKIICVRSPAYFGSIGRFYQIFDQVSDDQVLKIITEQAKRRRDHG
ncbi:Putative phosphoribosyl transferase [Anaerohalosphaera lusitana]|uniref:Putative phosphoribosyl transferase n=1 Tax=Anaerohalosphaera lusitana TaxID=1936003 RepID=A0A1U9NJI0_9BACT|nr:phosphoribosyltransferase family protein [Anaerohalosphaera lusitana]AQT67975.1 Putative phosphoribosyl transferase [Anaerohalosphaera lusitana]